MKTTERNDEKLKFTGRLRGRTKIYRETPSEKLKLSEKAREELKISETIREY